MDNGHGIACQTLVQNPDHTPRRLSLRKRTVLQYSTKHTAKERESAKRRRRRRPTRHCRSNRDKLLRWCVLLRHRNYNLHRRDLACFSRPGGSYHDITTTAISISSSYGKSSDVQPSGNATPTTTESTFTAVKATSTNVGSHHSHRSGRHVCANGFHFRRSRRSEGCRGIQSKVWNCRRRSARSSQLLVSNGKRREQHARQHHCHVSATTPK